ncbi:MAG: lactonase family protein [Planctomycetaceae bacterium]|nr:lactonase family protein [Planctomycetaceae bacterium]
MMFLSLVPGLGGGLTMAEDVLLFASAFAPGEEGAIQAFHLDVDMGRLQPLHRTTDVEHPFFMAISPNGKFLYSIHAAGQFGGQANEQVAAYRIDDSAGHLTLLNRQSALGTAACYLDVDATGRSVVVANYSTGNVASFPVNEDGSLGEAASFIQHTGSSVDTSRQEGPHAHCFVISPDNRLALSADLGLDQVLIYQLDSAKATLSPHDQPFVRTPPGAGPRHLTFHPNGRHVYVINEMANSVTAFDFVPESGMLIERETISTVPEGFDGTSYCADLKITPDGRFLYGTNRGHDSIAAYEIDKNGRLALLEIVPSLGKGPQNLAIAPGGKWLLCANMPGDNIAVFGIDPATGGLTPTPATSPLKSPSCILFP